MDPITGKQIEVCPWLKEVKPEPPKTRIQYHCKIYEQRPDDCRLYPSNISEMIIDECEMIEKKDRLNLKQAQIKLNDLMEDSWRG